MDRLPTPLEILADRRILSWFLVPVVSLPIGMAVLFLFGQIFALLGDTFSASMLNGTALVLGIFWCLSLVFLLIGAAFMLLREE